MKSKGNTLYSKGVFSLNPFTLTCDVKCKNTFISADDPVQKWLDGQKKQVRGRENSRSGRAA